MSLTDAIETTHRPIAFAGCEITRQAREAAVAVMRSGWLTTGPQTREFEARLGEWIGCEHVVAVSSCTAAIELSLRALGLAPGTAVLTPTVTFCGAVSAIIHSGLRPVFVDVDEATLTASPAQVAAAARGIRVGAMIVQHMAGFPAPVVELAAAAGLPLARVVEDAAHGLGAAVGDRPVGTVSGATCFSFYATKNLPIGEGGAVTTADPDLARRLRESRQHGMSHDAWARYLPGGRAGYDVREAGLKANFTDLQAAIGLGQLEQLTTWQRRRAELADRYDRGLAGIEGITLPPRPREGRHAWHLYVVRIGAGYGRSRADLVDALAAAGIGTSVHFTPVHQLTYFRDLLGDQAAALPVAERVGPTLLSLPLHPALDEDDVDVVCDRIAGLASPNGRR